MNVDSCLQNGVETIYNDEFSNTFINYSILFNKLTLNLLEKKRGHPYKQT